MRASDIQREIDRMAGKYEQDDGALSKDQIDQIKGMPVAWTRTDVYAPIVKEEVMLKHPELRQYYPVPLYYAPEA